MPDFSEEETAAKPRTRTVLTPDNDPSFTSGFFEKKNADEDAKEKAKERWRQIWGSQEHWSPGDNGPPIQEDDTPAPGAPGTAENPTRHQDSRKVVEDATKYVGEKAANRALRAFLSALFARGFPPLMMTKEQADKFRINDDPA